jgi:predicted phosphodiesterase
MKNMRKIVIVSDSHGDKIDRKVANLLTEFTAEFKPDIRIHLGDYLNAEAFRNGANEHERRVSLKDDAREALRFFEEFRPTHLLDGNHDYRLPLYVRHSPGPLADYVAEIIARVDKLAGELHTVRLPYHKRKGILKIGKLKALHGFFAGSNAGKQHAAAFGSCVFGHTHRFSTVSVPGADDGRAVARGVGCLCDLDMEYNSRHVDTLSQAQGWLYGVMDGVGRYWLNNAEVVNGKVAVFENFKILG